MTPNTPKTTIFRRLMRVFLPFVVVSVIAVSLLTTVATYVSFRNTIAEDYRNILIRSVGEIQAYLQSAQKGLESLGFILAHNKLSDWQQEISLTAFNHVNAQFLMVSLLSPKGEVRISTGAGEPSTRFDTSKAFQAAIESQTVWPEIVTDKNGIPFLGIAVPVRIMGKVSEVLWGVLDLKSIWDVLQETRIGQSGQLFILDLNGRYIGHPDMERVINLGKLDRSDILEALNVPDIVTQWTDKIDGQRYDFWGMRVATTNWILVLGQSRHELNSHLYQNIFLILVSAIGISLLATALAWFRAKWFLKPIQAMQRQATVIAGGDLDQRLPVTTADEIGELAQAFNEMSAKLKVQIEKRVQAARDLEHARNLAMLGTASSKMTHEVGNLINNIDMCMTALDSGTLADHQREFLAQVRKDTSRVTGLIQDFLQFAKKKNPQLTAFPLILPRGEIRTVYLKTAREKGVEIILDYPADLPKVPVDPGLIYQVFNNLIKNAMEAMPGPGTLTITGRIDGDNLCVDIADTGPGIDPEHIENIFEAFFSTKGKKGTGLGLAIVKGIVEAHDGELTVANRPDGGAVFTVGLPMGGRYQVSGVRC